MSFVLTYQGALTLPGGYVLDSATVRPSASEVIINVSFSGNSFTQRRSGTSPYSQVGSNLGMAAGAGPSCAVMASNTLMLAAGGGGSYLDVISNSTNAYPSLPNVASTRNMGMIASQPVSGTGMSCTTNTYEMLIFNGATVTANTITGIIHNLQRPTCVAASPNSTTTFIVALEETSTLPSMLVEVDINCNVVASLALPRESKSSSGGGTTIPRNVIYMAGYLGYLMVETSIGELLMIDWMTGRVMQRKSLCSLNNGINDAFLTFGQDSLYKNMLFAGGTASAGSSPVPLVSWDYLLTPIQDQPFNSLGFGQVGMVGVLPGISTVVVTDPVHAKIHFLTYTGLRGLTLQVGTGLQDLSSNPVAGDYIVLDNTVSPATMMFCSPMPSLAQGSTRTLPMTSGKASVLAIGRSGDGAGSLFSIDDYST